MDNLIEMKSLATQAANDTLSTTERTYIAKQINALGFDINDIAASSTFNGVALLPTSDATKTFQVGEGTSDTMSVTFETVDILALFGADGTDLGATDAIEVETGDHSAGGLSAGSSEARGELEFEVANSEVEAVHGDFNTFATKVDTAIGTLNGFMNQVGIDQRSLSNKEVNLTEAITANSAARSRIMDTDFAKEQSNSIRLQILQQTATAALSQANMGPQAVLGFLG
jgi:flagellin